MPYIYRIHHPSSSLTIQFAAFRYHQAKLLRCDLRLPTLTPMIAVRDMTVLEIGVFHTPTLLKTAPPLIARHLCKLYQWENVALSACVS